MRRSHIVDNLGGRLEKFNDGVRWLGALLGGQFWGATKEWLNLIW